MVAVSENGIIGKDDRLPWHFPSDLKHFKELTLGSTVMMGRKTFESIGKPLPGRENFVLSRSVAKQEANLKFFPSLEEALKKVATPKAFIIGGAQLFQETLYRVDGIFLTKIHQIYEGDVAYPVIPSYFKEKERKTLQENPKIEAIYYENIRGTKNR